MRIVTLLAVLLVAGMAAGQTTSNQPARTENVPEVLQSDGKLTFKFSPEQKVLARGLQPSLLRTAKGTLVLQAQVPEKPLPSTRMTYPSALETVVSRDDGKTWTQFPRPSGKSGLNMEGGAIQLRNGTIIALDTYICPGKKPGEGIGQLYTSTNDWQTLEGPEDVVFDLPGTDFYCSKDDGGRPHEAQRLHRRILELPNGDLLTTFYGWMKGDNAPSTYMPSMTKSRTMLARSTDHGHSWKLVGTVAVDPTIGTEGFGEPVIARVSKGSNAGRLFCQMRTGRELREAFSDDEGLTWTAHYPRVFAGLDIYKTDLWVDKVRNLKDRHGRYVDENNPDELRGAVVDPDLIELRSGLLMAAFGVRIPQKVCWKYAEHPWNGNYLAFSRDHGKTWGTVVRLTSGVMTTHYMAIEETLKDNRVFVAYDLGAWGKPNRDIYARFVEVEDKRGKD